MPHLLVVDDNLATCRALEWLLRRDGYDVTCAESGVEALKCLKDCSPEMLILDWMMPGLSGPELLRHLRADSRFDPLPVVIFSAVSEPTKIGDVIRMGAEGYIVKGTPWKIIRERLSNILARSQN